MEEQSTYPLTWPLNVPRARRNVRSAFKGQTISKAYGFLEGELRRMGVRKFVVSSNLRVRMDGKPYADQPKMLADPGVAVYFAMKSLPVCLPCDKWSSIADNLHAIGKHIEAMRGMERWGVGTVEQQFLGYKALTAASEEPWWNVLGVSEFSEVEQINLAFHRLAREAHPDLPGGSHSQMQKLNLARDRGLEARK